MVRIRRHTAQPEEQRRTQGNDIDIPAKQLTGIKPFRAAIPFDGAFNARDHRFAIRRIEVHVGYGEEQRIHEERV